MYFRIIYSSAARIIQQWQEFIRDEIGDGIDSFDGNFWTIYFAISRSTSNRGNVKNVERVQEIREIRAASSPREREFFHGTHSNSRNPITLNHSLWNVRIAADRIGWR